MIEAIFTILSLVLLFFTYRWLRDLAVLYGTVGILRSWRTWVVAVGILLLALPGVLTLSAALWQPAAAPLFAEGDEMIVPSGEGVALADARTFLLRGVIVHRGNLDHPIALFDDVITLGQSNRYDLVGGRHLRLRIARSGPARSSTGISCDYKLRRFGSTSGGDVSLRSKSDLEIDTGYAVAHQSIDVQNWNVRSFGTLLGDRSLPATLHLFLTPLNDRADVAAMPAREWWESNGSQLTGWLARFNDGFPSASSLSMQERYPSVLVIQNLFTSSGFLFLAAGAILLLSISYQRLRTVCVIVLFFVLYTCALDSAVLRINAVRLFDSEARLVSAAIVDTASSKLHPERAANILLRVARGSSESAVRTCALRCLDRPALLTVLRTHEQAASELEDLAAQEQGELSQAAGRILSRLD